MVIDTESSFRPERCAEIAARYDLNEEDVLRNISYVRALNSEHQYNLLFEASKMMSEGKYALLLVDSATSLFRTDYTGRQQLSERQSNLGLFMRKLMNIAIEFGVAVVVTNQVVANPGHNSMFVPTVPAGGNIMAHASTTRLQFRKGREKSIICKIFDSPTLPQVEANFQVTESGITDVDEKESKQST